MDCLGFIIMNVAISLRQNNSSYHSWFERILAHIVPHVRLFIFLGGILPAKRSNNGGISFED